MKLFDKTKLKFYAAGILLLLFVLSLSYFRVFDEFEYSTLDLRYKLRPHHNVKDDIIIIEIGDDSIDKIGKWPFPRNYHALLINALRTAGAKTIIFDVFFSNLISQ